MNPLMNGCEEEDGNKQSLYLNRSSRVSMSADGSYFNPDWRTRIDSSLNAQDHIHHNSPGTNVLLEFSRRISFDLANIMTRKSTAGKSVDSGKFKSVNLGKPEEAGALGGGRVRIDGGVGGG